MKHHRVEAELFELHEFPAERLRQADRGAVRVLAFTDVPGAETKFIAVFFRHRLSTAMLGILSEFGNCNPFGFHRTGPVLRSCNQSTSRLLGDAASNGKSFPARIGGVVRGSSQR